MKRSTALTGIALLFSVAFPTTGFAEDENWYTPTEVDAQLQPAPPPIPPQPPRKSRLLALQMPLYKFVAGDLEGGASSLRVRFDGKDGGFYLGLYQPGGWVDVGVDLNILGGTRVFGTGPIEIWALYPTTGVHLLSNFKEVVFGFPLTVSGVRVTTCDPMCFVADLRGPTADVLLSPGTGSIAVALGASLAVGVAF